MSNNSGSSCSTVFVSCLVIAIVAPCMLVSGCMLVMMNSPSSSGSVVWVDTHRAKSQSDPPTKTPTKSRSERLAEFRAKIAAATDEEPIVESVSLDPSNPDKVIIVVTRAWKRSPHKVRLAAAQTLWAVWAEINSPQEQDASRIRLIDRNGNEVGGSRLVGGSVIWVAD